jgi:hypothetical protein
MTKLCRTCPHLITSHPKTSYKKPNNFPKTYYKTPFFDTTVKGDNFARPLRYFIGCWKLTLWMKPNGIPSRPKQVRTRFRKIDQIIQTLHWQTQRLSLPETSKTALEPPDLLFNGCRGLYLELKRPVREVTTHLHLVPRIRISGHIPPPPYAFMACTTKSLTFTFFIKFIQK